MGLRNGSGMIARKLDGGIRHWALNSLPYNFGPYSEDDVTVDCRKEAGGLFLAKVTDTNGVGVILEAQLQDQVPPIPITVEWRDGTVTLEVQGIVADSQSVAQPP
jgi:hypothetical protein